jgi:hypothetical protein
MLFPGLLAAALSAPPAPAPSPPPAPEIEVAGPELGAVRVPSVAGAWGGPRTGGEPTLSDRVADHVLRAVLDPVKHTVEGTARLTWRNRSAVPVRSLYFHLYLNAFESEGSTFQQEERRYGGFRGDSQTEEGQWGYIELRSVTQGGRAARWTFVHPDGGPDTDHTVVRVDLPEAVPAGGATTLDLAFFDQLPRVTARTGWWGSFHLVGQWYPKIGVLELPGERGATRPRWNCHEFHLNSEFYADFGAYDLTIVAPAGVTVAASGERVGLPEKTADGVVHRFRADDVHDVAFTAWDGFAEPLEATFTGRGSPEVKVRVLYPPEMEESAREALQATLDALRHFSETLGPYPYRTSTAVMPPFNADGAAGMEYETFFTTQGAARGLPLASPGFTRYVTVHEVGHGYFMGLLASNEFEEPFLDEGLDEWWCTRMLAGEAAPLRAPGFLRWLGFPGARIRPFDFERGGGAVRHAADPVAGNSWNRYSSGSYGLIYSRTVVAFEDLATRVGQETAARAMKLYYQRWHFRHPSTADLRQAWLDAAPDASARAVIERWFEEQVFSASPVDDRVVSVESREVLPGIGFTLDPASGKRVELDEDARDGQVREARKAWKKEHGEPEKAKPGPFPWRSVITVRRYAAHVPRTVLVTFEDGSVERLPWPEGQRWARWELDRPVRARQAELDPERPVLLDLDRLDDGRTREPRHGPAVKLALGAESWLRVVLALVEAL